MSTSIRQTYKRTEIWEQLVDDWNLFDNYQDLFVFAGCVGYAENQIEEDDYTGDGEILWMHFSDKDLYRAAAASIAYQYTDNPEALIEPEIQLKVMAKYAAGGAKILQQKFGDNVGTPREALLNYIENHEDDTEADQKSVITQIAKDFDKSMRST